MTPGARLRTGVRLRLIHTQPFIRTWAQAMAIGALPSNLPHTLTSLSIMVDELWHLAGDRTTDVQSWYTNRALLLSVYASTGVSSRSLFA